MFADDYGRQTTFDAFDETTSDLVQTAATERNERAELLVSAGLTVSELEELAYGAEVFPLQEWLDFSPEDQQTLLDARLARLKRELTDRLGESDATGTGGADDTLAFGFEHDHVETDGRWGYD